MVCLVYLVPVFKVVMIAIRFKQVIQPVLAQEASLTGVHHSAMNMICGMLQNTTIVACSRWPTRDQTQTGELIK